ncbi:hypothetical protein [Amycolatopsis sp. NPDC059657]|uniref:hypothetical protein n=1 Tax=Amycolatopsis sp. NPDC059657 TaxID=3346899 RepID=UPI00366C0160
MVTRAHATRGTIAGASGDGGVEYRRGVAAYAVALGLSGVPLPELGLESEYAQVEAVALETVDAVDDIRIDLKSSGKVMVQAKRSLHPSGAFKAAVAQWVEAGKGDLDPSKDRLVLVSAELPSKMRHLRQALNRQRQKIPGDLSEPERKAYESVESLLTELTDEQRQRVLACAVIWELAVEEPDHASAREAISNLRAVVEGGHASARQAWKSLVVQAGRMARLRSGYILKGWKDALEGEGIEFTCTGDAPSARLERVKQAVKRYKAVSFTTVSTST